MAGYDDLNDAERLSNDTTFHLVGSEEIDNSMNGREWPGFSAANALFFGTNQQLHAACLDHRPNLQAALASGTVLLMDQAASTHQALSRHQRERGQDPNLDRRQHLRSGRHRPQTARPGGQPLPNPTDSQPNSVRENFHFTGTSRDGLREQLRRYWQPVESVRLVAGQQ